MFTGIIEAIGKVVFCENKGADARLGVHPGKLDLAEIRLGDSIAVQGVCLTVAELVGGNFYADVSAETLRCTTLSGLKAGSPVNLDEARAGDLIFFATAGGGRVSHVGLYLGQGAFIHAPRSGQGIRQDNLSDRYYREGFLGIRSYI